MREKVNHEGETTLAVLFLTLNKTSRPCSEDVIIAIFSFLLLPP